MEVGEHSVRRIISSPESPPVPPEPPLPAEQQLFEHSRSSRASGFERQRREVRPLLWATAAGPLQLQERGASRRKARGELAVGSATARAAAHTATGCASSPGRITRSCALIAAARAAIARASTAARSASSRRAPPNACAASPNSGRWSGAAAGPTSPSSTSRNSPTSRPMPRQHWRRAPAASEPTPRPLITRMVHTAPAPSPPPPRSPFRTVRSHSNPFRRRSRESIRSPTTCPTGASRASTAARRSRRLCRGIRLWVKLERASRRRSGWIRRRWRPRGLRMRRGNAQVCPPRLHCNRSSTPRKREPEPFLPNCQPLSPARGRAPDTDPEAEPRVRNGPPEPAGPTPELVSVPIAQLQQLQMLGMMGMLAVQATSAALPNTGADTNPHSSTRSSSSRQWTWARQQLPASAALPFVAVQQLIALALAQASGGAASRGLAAGRGARRRPPAARRGEPPKRAAGAGEFAGASAGEPAAGQLFASGAHTGSTNGEADEDSAPGAGHSASARPLRTQHQHAVEVGGAHRQTASRGELQQRGHCANLSSPCEGVPRVQQRLRRRSNQHMRFAFALLQTRRRRSSTSFAERPTCSGMYMRPATTISSLCRVPVSEQKRQRSPHLVIANAPSDNWRAGTRLLQQQNGDLSGEVGAQCGPRMKRARWDAASTVCAFLYCKITYSISYSNSLCWLCWSFAK